MICPHTRSGLINDVPQLVGSPVTIALATIAWCTTTARWHRFRWRSRCWAFCCATSTPPRRPSMQAMWRVLPAGLSGRTQPCTWRFWMRYPFCISKPGTHHVGKANPWLFAKWSWNFARRLSCHHSLVFGHPTFPSGFGIAVACTACEGPATVVHLGVTPTRCGKNGMVPV